MTAKRFVQGEIVLPGSRVPEKSASVVVQIEDVSRADQSSKVIGEQRMQDVPLKSGRVLPFRIEVSPGDIDERKTYSLRVHVDVTGSGEVELGDLVSTRSYPVLTRGNPDHASIRVQRV